MKRASQCVASLSITSLDKANESNWMNVPGNIKSNGYGFSTYDNAHIVKFPFAPVETFVFLFPLKRIIALKVNFAPNSAAVLLHHEKRHPAIP